MEAGPVPQAPAGPTRWVVWGVGSPTPEEFFDVETGDDRIAAGITSVDRGWQSDPEGWSAVVHADREEIAAWVERTPSARGYVPYEQPTFGEKVEKPRPY